MEACNSEPDIIADKRENSIISNIKVIMDSSIPLSPQVVYRSSPSYPLSDGAEGLSLTPDHLVEFILPSSWQPGLATQT